MPSITTDSQHPLHNSAFVDHDVAESSSVNLASLPRRSVPSSSIPSPLLEDVEQEMERYGKLIDTYGNEFYPPDYTIKQVRDAIPKHCFKRSAIRGYCYIARDITCLTLVFVLFQKFATPIYVPNTIVRGILWTTYTILQGLFGTGIWVIAHECGHGAFSDSRIINDTTGWLLHSLLLVPYFSWKISHSKHHKATGHMEREMVFLPYTREQYASRIGRLIHELSESAEETPIFTLLHLLGQQLMGWPLYLVSNMTGHNFHYRQREGRGKGKTNGFGGGVNHFDPQSPIFDTKHTKLIIYSNTGIALTGTILCYLGNKFGWVNIFLWYFIPYLWVNHWLVAITFLQHTDPSLPHYTADAWNYVRGAAATIDREMGFIGRHLLHGIVETHVVHHYDNKIPFYHADEATAAIRPILGKHYRSDTAGGFLGFLCALWRNARMCQWVEPSVEAEGKGNGILFFRNTNGIGPKPIQIAAQGSETSN